MKRILIAVFLLAFASPLRPASRGLEVYVIDVEGGKAMLVVGPSGESMLVDAGWPPRYQERGKPIEPGDRDTGRIARAVRKAGLKRLDYMVVTHYDIDHVQNVPRLVEKLGLPVGAYVDHGPTVFPNPAQRRDVEPYFALRDKARHLAVKAGDRIPMKGVDILVAASGGVGLQPRAGTPSNPACEGVVKPPNNAAQDENDAGVGLLFTFGRFRMIDLGDLLRGMEYDLVCPANPAGTVDLFMVSTHGLAYSNTRPLVHALRPRVAIMNNGATKGGEPAVWKTLTSSPGIEDIWQLHYSERGGTQANPPAGFIANTGPEAGCAGWWLKVTAHEDGNFSVQNERTGFRKVYRPRK